VHYVDIENLKTNISNRRLFHLLAFSRIQPSFLSLSHLAFYRGVHKTDK
jgi:hypothetical protein